MVVGTTRPHVQTATFSSIFTLQPVAYGLDASTRLTEATISNVIKDWILPTWSTSVHQDQGIGTYVRADGNRVGRRAAFAGTSFARSNMWTGCRAMKFTSLKRCGLDNVPNSRNTVISHAKMVVEHFRSTSNESVPCLDGHRAALYCSDRYQWTDSEEIHLASQQRCT